MTENSKNLIILEKSLFGVIAAITQTPSKSVKRVRTVSSIATAKVTGVATTAGIYGLVSTFGAAGTGISIGTLSGAASTSATMAWIGGLVGGGMAAGALLLPVVGLAAGGAAVYVVRRKLHSRPRKLDELLPFEDEILFSADSLLRPLSGALKNEHAQPSPTELRIFAHDGLLPFAEQIKRHVDASPDEACANFPISFQTTLTPKYQTKLRKHIREIQKTATILARVERKSMSERLGLRASKCRRKLKPSTNAPKPASHLSSVVLVVTFQRLLADRISDWSAEHDLVLNALRRSTGDLTDASIADLSAYVGNLTPDQLRGVVSNTKGIYHEMLFVEMHTAAGTPFTAQMMEATNHPGADVRFTLDGDVVREVQLKAIASPTLVYEHLQRYPDIEILVTEEVAAMMEGIDSSGLNNVVLSRDVTERLHDLQGEGLLEEISDGIITSAFVTSGILVWNVMHKKTLLNKDLKPYLANAGIAVGTATMIDGAIAMMGN
jgi:hypothetical protein